MRNTGTRSRQRRRLFALRVSSPEKRAVAFHSDRGTAERLFAGFAARWPVERDFTVRLERQFVPTSLTTDQQIRDHLLTHRGTELAAGGAPAVPLMPRVVTAYTLAEAERDIYAEACAAHGFDPLAERDERMVKS